MSRFGRIGVAAALAYVGLGQAAALAQTGTIAGVARDTTGALVPGVTVEAASPALIEKVRTAVTDGLGRYKIIDLRPGTYTVTFTLTGFNVLKREGIVLTADFTAAVNADLRLGAVAETVTVTGESPLVDTQSVTQRKSLTSDVISALPSGRSFQTLAVLVPGVSLGAGLPQDVGGTGGERYQTLSVHGSRSDQMPLVLNGMPYNNMNNTGGGYNTTLVVNTGTVQEMTITTSGLSAESRSSGVLTNTIPKEGGNTFRGNLFANFANQDFQANNLTPELIRAGPASREQRQQDLGFQPDVRRTDHQGHAVVLRRTPLLGGAELHRRHVSEPAPDGAAGTAPIPRAVSSAAIRFTP